MRTSHAGQALARPTLTRRDMLRLAGGLALAAPTLLRAQPAGIGVQARTVTSQAEDGVPLAVYETGNRQGRPIVFIHGYTQSHESWSKQFADAGLRRDFHLIAFDLRGHGKSGKPMTAEAYRDPRRWAGDVRAVIEATCRQRPCLVGWSYAGRVMNDYLGAYGDAGLAAINYVDATSTANPAMLGRSAALMRPLASEDPKAAAEAVEPFLRACFEKQPPEAELREMIRFNKETPPAVRRFMGGRPADYDDVLRKVRVPVLITHGRLDQISAVAMSEYTASLIPHARLSIYEGVGHSPFYEDPARFNAELATLNAA
ncbi:alpha/beta fold hydrolase [Bordetella genomosp. 13]|nr:alpha/beta hydrolase [Bordetella genomosp. 13]